MFRRDFLKSLVAAAAGMAAAAQSGELTAAVNKASPAAPPRKPINVALGAKTSDYRADLCDAQRRVLELIKECTVVSFSRSIGVGELPRYQVVYEHREGQKPKRTPFTDDAERLAVVGHPINISVSSTVDVEVPHLGEYRPIQMERVAHQVEIEWITTPANFV